MPLYRKMKSPLGYQNLTNSSLDSYGVDHSGFTTRDELEYQFARQERENLLMDQEKQNGVTDHFTQYGHNFWGTPQENNYGFGSSNISENIKQLKNNFNTYSRPMINSNDPNWGNKTEYFLNNYLKTKSNSYPGKENSGFIAPFKDMWQNYKDMRDIDLVGADNFFHCKANYEAAKRGPWGDIVSKTISLGREMFGLATGEPLSDSQKDWVANQKGWNGAKEGRSLQESCPRNPREYYHPKYYKKTF